MTESKEKSLAISGYFAARLAACIAEKLEK